MIIINQSDEKEWYVQKLKIGICDDVSHERQKLIEYIRRFEQEQSLIFEIKEYDSAKLLIRDIHMGEKIDMLFLDIYMNDLNGMEAAKILHEEEFKGSIIFCTASREYAVDSYFVEAEGYIVKPYEYEDFLRVMKRTRSRWEKLRKNVSFISKRVDRAVFISDIIYIETFGKGCAVHTENETMETRKAIGEFEKELEAEKCFLRMGKSYLVNLEYVKCYDKEFMVLDSGDRLALPVRERTRIKKIVNEYQWLKFTEE